MNIIIENIEVIGIIAAVIILLSLIIASGYRKAPPDEAYIISGLRKKILIGKAGIKLPFFERIDRLSLKLISVDVKTTTSVPTSDYINVNVDSVVNIKISDDPDMIKIAAQNFLNRPTDYICDLAREVLEGNTREIVGQMGLREMVTDRKKFAEKVQENAQPDLAKMGLEIISFNVHNLVDEQGLIENLGIDNTSEIQKTAAITKANAERDIEIAKAAAKQSANEAKKAVAEATKYAKLQEAEGIKAVGDAEADAIKAKALAEAEGLNKKAEAMQKMQEAAVLQMYFDVLPLIAKSVAEPLSKIDSITMYG